MPTLQATVINKQTPVVSLPWSYAEEHTHVHTHSLCSLGLEFAIASTLQSRKQTLKLKPMVTKAPAIEVLAGKAETKQTQYVFQGFYCCEETPRPQQIL